MGSGLAAYSSLNPKAVIAAANYLTHILPMFRLLLSAIIAATLGSLSATLIFTSVELGDGEVVPMRFLLNISAMAMVFTTPGVIMLIGAKAVLRQRAVGTLIGPAMLLLGALAGGAALVVPAGLRGMVIGGLYGFTSALALMAIDTLTRRKAVMRSNFIPPT